LAGDLFTIFATLSRFAGENLPRTAITNLGSDCGTSWTNAVASEMSVVTSTPVAIFAAPRAPSTSPIALRTSFCSSGDVLICG
jgi:hypothetical protein